MLFEFNATKTMKINNMFSEVWLLSEVLLNISTFVLQYQQNDCVDEEDLKRSPYHFTKG